MKKTRVDCKDSEWNEGQIVANHRGIGFPPETSNPAAALAVVVLYGINSTVCFGNHHSFHT